MDIYLSGFDILDYERPMVVRTAASAPSNQLVIFYGEYEYVLYSLPKNYEEALKFVEEYEAIRTSPLMKALK